MQEREVFDAVGVEGFTRLVRNFYEQVPSDDILGPMYPADDMDGAEERLRSFLIYRFGGPQDYIVNRGHPRLRMRHAPFPIDEAAAQRWYEIMSRAMRESNLNEEAAVVLNHFFAHMVDFLRNR